MFRNRLLKNCHVIASTTFTAVQNLVEIRPSMGGFWAGEIEQTIEMRGKA